MASAQRHELVLAPLPSPWGACTALGRVALLLLLRLVASMMWWISERMASSSGVGTPGLRPRGPTFASHLAGHDSPSFIFGHAPDEPSTELKDVSRNRCGFRSPEASKTQVLAQAHFQR